ncbi:glycosyltransferase involved in cell wall biogenesis [Mycobacterium dioxanotrophicus]|uniref:Glycosyltransferase involved in cell wall biogenesis n=1 Tax=Mycobacterium dioxanotrophicus TaxID=482462 RepID=A0A1Y0BYW3_9MYCO|nr:DUF2064 domain-containing protein [Mycobacterium dioxanotrophicus]ART68088.1 glycosyltransferase involved in cell wall biogenesis [Mycobacterium dioxanotrophicus]
MKPVAVLVVAKAPVPGLAKTRLAASIGAEAAADIAAAALLDTLDAAVAAAVEARVVALTGDLQQARRGHEICDRLADFIVVPQRGENFAERLANAHADAAAATGLPVLQIGMDTPQVSGALLDECANALSGADAVLGMARDGGWWILGVRHCRTAACLADVEMSTSRTGVETLAALRSTGATVALATELADFDTVDDVDDVRRVCPAGSRFVRATRGL